MSGVVNYSQLGSHHLYSPYRHTHTPVNPANSHLHSVNISTSETGADEMMGKLEFNSDGIRMVSIYFKLWEWQIPRLIEFSCQESVNAGILS